MEPMKEKGNSSFTFLRPLQRLNAFQKAVRILYNGLLKLYVRLVPPEYNAKRKYHISVCQIFKDEAPYLKEWLEYHLLIGIDHFYLYDNNSSDNYRDILESYIAAGTVTLLPWTPDHAQTAAYEDCIRRFREESDWIGFIDVDEFIVPVAEASFPAFLDRFSHRPAVLLYWRFFGSGGMIQRDTSRLVCEDFTVASEKLYNKGKCFYNSNYQYAWNCEKNKTMFHMLWCRVGHRLIPAVDMFDRFTVGSWFRPFHREIPLQLNHYAIKSYTEHLEKNKKGDIFYEKPTHGDDVFYMRDQRCSVADYRIYKYLTLLKRRISGDV